MKVPYINGNTVTPQAAWKTGWDRAEKNLLGTTSVVLAANAYALTEDDSKAHIIEVTGLLTADGTLTFLEGDEYARHHIIWNRTTGAFSLLAVVDGSVIEVEIPQDKAVEVIHSGTSLVMVGSSEGGGGGSNTSLFIQDAEPAGVPDGSVWIDTNEELPDPNVTLGNAATKNVGTTAGTVAAGDHVHIADGIRLANDNVVSLTSYSHELILWPTEHKKVGIEHSITVDTGNCVIKKAGWYAMSVNAGYEANMSGGARQVSIKINGVFSASNTVAPNAIPSCVQCTLFRYLNVNDVVTFHQYHDSPNPMNTFVFNDFTTRASIVLVGR